MNSCCGSSWDVSAGACRFVPLSHGTYGRVATPAFACLHQNAEFAVSRSTGALLVTHNAFMESSTSDLSTTLCRGIAR